MPDKPNMTTDTLSPQRRVLAWDGPTRLFKWAFVALIVMAPLSNKFGDSTLLWHKLNGYAILTLVLFRLLWGFAGGTTARFSSFIRSPATILGYGLDSVRGVKRRFLGHNPLGALMVLALLAVAAAQGLTGLFTTDDIIVEGPLVPLASSAWVKTASVFHHTGFKLVLILSALHILANFAYTFVKKDNLIRPMVTGWKPEGAYEDASEAEAGSWLTAAICLAIAAAIVWGGLALFGTSPFR